MGLGRSLQMHVTVEGVESARQVTFVRNVHCDQVQGFLFGRPMPAADVGAEIQRAAPHLPWRRRARIRA